MAEYRLAPAALRDMEDIWRFTRETWGADQALLYSDLLIEAFQKLADAPMMAPACDDIRPGYRRQNVERHRVYFRIVPYGIAIIRILHERMDAPRHL